MIPGEVSCTDGDVELKAGAEAIRVEVANTAERPVQVGSHCHFGEVNAAWRLDRIAAHGQRLDIAAGTAVRFEPGQTREVQLVLYGGARKVYGFNQQIMGAF